MLSECTDGTSTIAGIDTYTPHLAVIDSQLPDMSAQQIIEAVRINNQTTRIIVLGASADRGFADQLLAAGADAYIVRNGPSRHLNEAIREVADGGKYLAPQLTRDSSVITNGHPSTENSEVVTTLRTAVAAQAKVVERLERAMDRAQYAIELLQQKVQRLSGTPMEPGAVTWMESGGNRLAANLPANIGPVAAASMAAAVGFMLPGILHTGPVSAISELAGMSTEDSYRAANVGPSRVLPSVLFHQGSVEESKDVVRWMAVPVPRDSRSPAGRFSFDN